MHRFYIINLRISYRFHMIIARFEYMSRDGIEKVHFLHFMCIIARNKDKSKNIVPVYKMQFESHTMLCVSHTFIQNCFGNRIVHQNELTLLFAPYTFCWGGWRTPQNLPQGGCLHFHFASKSIFVEDRTVWTQMNGGMGLTDFAFGKQKSSL